MATELTLETVSAMCRDLEASAKALAEWTRWGDLATETQPGAREVIVPGCLDLAVLHSRAEDLLAQAQAILDGVTGPASESA